MHVENVEDGMVMRMICDFDAVAMNVLVVWLMLTRLDQHANSAKRCFVWFSSFFSHYLREYQTRTLVLIYNSRVLIGFCAVRSQRLCFHCIS